MKKIKGWITGNGMIIDIGYMTEEEYKKFYTMSSDARKQFVLEYINKYPKAFINTAGYCIKNKKHMSEKDCLICARLQGMLKIAEFNICRTQNLSRL